MQLFTEFADHIAVRKILHGVKGRVEGVVEPVWVQHVEFFTFVTTCLVFVAALIVIVVRHATLKTWATGFAGGVVWLVTWYAPIPTWPNAGIALLSVVALCLVSRAVAKCC